MLVLHAKIQASAAGHRKASATGAGGAWRATCPCLRRGEEAVHHRRQLGGLGDQAEVPAGVDVQA